jgi:hypothetical protein|nr:PT domain-containing protein [Prevotella sp.]
MEGWLKLYRKLTEWEWYKDSHMVHLFLHLLMTASPYDRSVRGKSVKKGQIVTSLATLSEQTGITVRSIRTCLSRLVETSEITMISDKQFRLITICKYDSYQVSVSSSDKGATNKTTKQPTNEMTNEVTNQPTNKTTNKINPQSTKKQVVTSIKNELATNEMTNEVTNQPTKQPTNKTTNKTTTEREYNNIYNNSKIASTNVPAMERTLAAGCDLNFDFKEFYNKTLDENHSTMPRIRSKIENQRKSMLEARIRNYGIENVKKVIVLASQSDFLNGGGERGFVATFDWILKPNNFPKILDGNYNNTAHGTENENRNSAIEDGDGLGINADPATRERLKGYAELFAEAERENESALRNQKLRRQTVVHEPF